MYSFKNDYSEGAHPRILEALGRTNFEQLDGYGEDSYCRSAEQLLLDRIQNPMAKVYFLVGGTQTNLTVLSAFLRPHEAVIAASTGHILVHETGAIENTGHKILSIDTTEGKLCPQDLQNTIDAHTDEHMVKPKLVYISNPTEIGTVYTRAELSALYSFCQEKSLILYLDGARLGSALCSTGNDVTLSDLGRYTDAFYIGGTKNGALLGEALVIAKVELQKDFRFLMKQKGALLAKGRMLGIQFAELFMDNLYFELAEHANQRADQLASEIGKMGYPFLIHSPSNQVFPILPDSIIEKLYEEFGFYIWSKTDEKHSAIRLVTSWATSSDAIEAFISKLKELS